LAETLKIMVDSKIENTSLTLFLIDVYFTYRRWNRFCWQTFKESSARKWI
jgi:hypothetical protein